jgi:hypothetical protein
MSYDVKRFKAVLVKAYIRSLNEKLSWTSGVEKRRKIINQVEIISKWYNGKYLPYMITK